MNLPDVIKEKSDLWIAGVVIATGFLIGSGLGNPIELIESPDLESSNPETDAETTDDAESMDGNLSLVTNVSWKDLEYDSSDDVYYAPNGSLRNPRNTSVIAYNSSYFGKDSSGPGGLYFKQDRNFDDANIGLYLNTTAQEIDLKTEFNFGNTEERIGSTIRYYEEEISENTDFRNYTSREQLIIGQERGRVLDINPPQGTEGVTATFWTVCPCDGSDLGKQEVRFTSLEVYA